MPALNLDVNDLIKASLACTLIDICSLRESRALDTIIRCKFVCHLLIELHQLCTLSVMQFFLPHRFSQSQGAPLSQGHTQSTTPLAERCYRFIAHLRFQPIALFLLSSPFQQVVIVQPMIRATKKVFTRGRSATREVLIVCNGDLYKAQNHACYFTLSAFTRDYESRQFTPQIGL